MPPTTSFDFGDVVLVPFPFTDQSATKKRPAVVAARLLKPSVIKPLLATVERSIVLHRLGKLHPDDVASLRRVLTEILG